MTLASLVLAPVSGYALDTTTKTSAVSPKTSSFCAELPNKLSATTARVTGLTDKVNQASTQQDQKMIAEYQKVDQDVANGRQKADTKRVTDFNKLEAKANTDAKKQAIAPYEVAVRNAVNLRRAAYDAARKAYRSGAQAAVTSHHTIVTAQLNTFQGSVNAAFSTATTSCAATANQGPTIHTALQTSLKSARETFRSSRKADTTVGSQIKQLAVTRQAAFKSADQIFKTSLTTARQALKQAFDKSSI